MVVECININNSYFYEAYKIINQFISTNKLIELIFYVT